MEEKENDSIYARWLSGELTEQEMQQLEASGELAVLRSIIEAVDNFEIPDLKKDSYSQIQAKISSAAKKRKAKVIPLYRRPVFIAAAATLLIVVGLFVFWQPSASNLIEAAPVELLGSAGKVKSIDLPDNTGVKLYGNSKLTYDKNAFGKKRVLKLKGEAYFDVRKKGHFEVQFDQGTVLVKGTRFTVLSAKNESAVRCYEGKVEVQLGENKITLTKGQAVRLSTNQQAETYRFQDTEILESESKFVENLSLHEVCASLSIYYGVEFETGNTDLNRAFTGAIFLGDLETALGIIFTPMSISYEIKDKQVILSNK